MVTTTTEIINDHASTIRTTDDLSNQSISFSSSETSSSSSVEVNDPSTVSYGRIIQRQLNDLLNEPISEKHQQFFVKHFGNDISTQTFTVAEFCRYLQITTKLGIRLLFVFKLNQSHESDAISGSDMIRIAYVLRISQIPMKAFILFKLFDSNDDDKVSRDEIRLFHTESFPESQVIIDKKRYNEVADTFVEDFFPERDDIHQRGLNFDEFYRILERNPTLFKSLDLISIPNQIKEDDKQVIWYKRWWTYIKNNKNRMVFRLLYIMSTLSLITYVIVHRTWILKDHTAWQVIARIGGMLINFNFALAITLMLKQTMTIIRRVYYLRLFIPVDDHIDAHRLVGTMLCISAMIHTIGHSIQFATHTLESSLHESLFTTAAHLGWVGDSAALTGDILFLLLIIMFICSLQCIRQRPGFYKLFYYTHSLFWIIFVLLVIHSKDFWKWAVGPMSLLIIEKTYLLKRHLPNYGRTRLISVQIEAGNALSLIIERPKNFKFQTGEYIYISLPNIARYEWHPFTISSSPKRKDILRVTIMKQQNWTKKVYEHFNAQLAQSNDHNYLTEVITDTANRHSYTIPRDVILSNEIDFTNNQKDSVICVEGPFSSCTSYIFDCEHVVLIGAGIGITPYISALETLVHRLRQQRCICYRCGAVNYNQNASKSRKLKKVDFIWTTRDSRNFSWFRSILHEFEAEQESYLNAINSNENDHPEQRSRYLDIHLYYTALQNNGQAMLGNLPYNLVANMYEDVRHQDMHTQLKTPTHLGRPEWNLLFSKFKVEHPSTNVFFTGSANMGDVIKRYCDQYEFPFQHEPYF